MPSCFARARIAEQCRQRFRFASGAEGSLPFLWPFPRGSRIRDALAYVGFPWLVLVGCWHVLRFRPTGLVAIYYRVSWVFAAYLISRICRVPLVYHVHDALRENYDGKQGIRNRFGCLDRARALRSARGGPGSPHGRSLSGTLRHRVPNSARTSCGESRSPVRRENRDGPLVIGFSGAV